MIKDAQEPVKSQLNVDLQSLQAQQRYTEFATASRAHKRTHPDGYQPVRSPENILPSKKSQSNTPEPPSSLLL